MHLRNLLYALIIIACISPTTAINAQINEWTPASPFTFDRQQRDQVSLEKIHLKYFEQSASFDFDKLMDTCSRYIQAIDDSMAILERQNLAQNPELEAKWDHLFEKKYVMFQQSISTYTVKGASSFAEVIKSQLIRLDMISQDMSYQLKTPPGIADSSMVKYYQIRAIVNKVWVYIFLTPEQKPTTKVVFIAQLAVKEKKRTPVQQGRSLPRTTPDGYNSTETEAKISISGGLSNRTVVKYPPEPATANDTGIVVIEVCVDTAGIVTSANYTLRGSTTPSMELRTTAIKIAKKFIFAKASEMQCGSIIFRFKQKQ